MTISFPQLPLLLLFVWAIGTPLLAQKDRQTQIKAAAALPLGIEDASMFVDMMATMPGYGGARESLERQSVKPYMMPVRESGRGGSDWSYALASCLEYYVNRDRNYKDNLSPDYVALSVRSSGEKPSLAAGLKFLATTGTVSAAIMPFGASAIPNAVFATSKYQITNYLHLFREQTKARQKVFEVRMALTRGNPVLISFAAPRNFPQFRGAAYPSGQPKEFVYNVLVVGYDETTKAFEITSCQGGDWGANGYAWIDYDTFGAQALDGYVMIPNVY